MSVISREYNFICSMPPRTGSTSLTSYLINNYQVKEIPNESISSGDIFIYEKHTTFKDLVTYGFIKESNLKSFMTFITVRNPFDSLYSEWYKRKYTLAHLLKDKNSWVYTNSEYYKGMLIAKDKTFNEWVECAYGSFSERKIKLELFQSFIPYCDNFLKFESLKDDLKKLFESNSIPVVGALPVYNVTKGRSKDYRTEYSNESRSIIENVFIDDLNEFNYEF